MARRGGLPLRLAGGLAGLEGSQEPLPPREVDGLLERAEHRVGDLSMTMYARVRTLEHALAMLA